eukprot:5920039-Alexandrium_andersonii.AAC.1
MVDPPASELRPGSPPQDCCPLCGRAEGSAEHLLIWCPAVHVAWAELGGPETPPLLQALLAHP